MHTSGRSPPVFFYGVCFDVSTLLTQALALARISTAERGCTFELMKLLPEPDITAQMMRRYLFGPTYGISGADEVGIAHEWPLAHLQGGPLAKLRLRVPVRQRDAHRRDLFLARDHVHATRRPDPYRNSRAPDECGLLPRRHGAWLHLADLVQLTTACKILRTIYSYPLHPLKR